MGIVISSGTRTVTSGQSLTPYVNGSGVVVVSNGGKVTDGSFCSGGKEIISSGGSDSASIVFSAGSIYVLKSGFAYNTDIYGKGYVSAAGGRVHNAVIGSSGVLDIVGWSSGGSTVYGYASNATISSGGQVVLGYYATGSAFNVLSGYVYVSSGGFLQEATIGSGAGAAMGAQVYIKPNGSGRLNRIYSNGFMTVSSAGNAALTKVFSGGSLVVSSGGSISGTVIGSSGLAGGRVELMPGAKATDTTIMSGGRMVADSSIISGTTQYAGTVSITLGWSDSGTISGGTAYLYGASSLNEKLLGGVMNVSRIDVNRGYVSNVTVQNATLYLNSGTYLDKATVSSGGKLYVYDGARASGVDVKTDGAAFIKNGGSMTGGSIYGSETVTSGIAWACFSENSKWMAMRATARLPAAEASSCPAAVSSQTAACPPRRKSPSRPTVRRRSPRRPA